MFIVEVSIGLLSLPLGGISLNKRQTRIQFKEKQEKPFDLRLLKLFFCSKIGQEGFILKKYLKSFREG